MVLFLATIGSILIAITVKLALIDLGSVPGSSDAQLQFLVNQYGKSLWIDFLVPCIILPLGIEITNTTFNLDVEHLKKIVWINPLISLFISGFVFVTILPRFGLNNIWITIISPAIICFVSLIINIVISSEQ